jgi:hypothetical protein
MPEPSSERSIKVTAEERAHPAIRKLARAMLALARLEMTAASPEDELERPPAAPEVSK